MRFAAAFILAGASIAAAQSSTAAAAPAQSSASTSGCGKAVDLIIASCLTTEEPGVKACKPNDWHCLCTAQTNVATCYNNCPSDPNAFGAQQTQTSYCNAAKAYPASSSTAASGGHTTAASPASSSSSKGNGVHTGFATASGSASASASATNAASGLTPAGGLLAAFFGLALL